MLYQGIVQRGEGRGRALGYPTANIPFEEKEVTGIYAALARFEGKEYRAAVFIDAKREVLEAHLLDFDGDMYDKELVVTLEKKIRESAQFTDEETLKKTIAADVAAVRTYFA